MNQPADEEIEAWAAQQGISVAEIRERVARNRKAMQETSERMTLMVAASRERSNARTVWLDHIHRC